MSPSTRRFLLFTKTEASATRQKPSESVCASVRRSEPPRARLIRGETPQDAPKLLGARPRFHGIQIDQDGRDGPAETQEPISLSPDIITQHHGSPADPLHRELHHRDVTVGEGSFESALDGPGRETQTRP